MRCSPTRRLVLALIGLLPIACADESTQAPGDAAAEADPSDGRDDTADLPPGDLADTPDVDLDALDDPDTSDEEVSPRTYDFAVGAPFPEAPDDLLAGSELTSCPIYQDETCREGVRYRCAVWDAEASDFTDVVDPLFERVLQYERWYDLYHQPDGQTAERLFGRPMAAGTPESGWGAAGAFAGFDGVGDSAIWTGVALDAYLLRYLETGTEADYQRMETKVRQLLRLFDVTGIPGYLARFHYLMLPEGGPSTDQLIVRHGEDGGPTDRPISDPESIEGLPAAYLDGLADDEGTVWQGTPRWRGNPSIDQYSGSEVALPAAYGLLRDDALRARIADSLTCYLNRLQRVELINLQDNPDALEAAQSFLAGSGLQLDEDDIDFSELDLIVAFAHRQLNSANARSFDATCPDGPPLLAGRVLDASSPGFALDLLNLGADLLGGATPRPTAIDHLYVPSVRGGDAIHMMDLAALAYWFTGDPVYADFLQDELIGRLRTIEVAHTAGALKPPRWCRSFYGDHITIPPLWAFINLLEDSPLRDAMFEVFERESWEKSAIELGNAKFDLMYAGVVPAELAADRVDALAEAVAALDAMGGNGGVLDDPRRNYSLAYDDVVAALPEGIAPICPTEAQRHACEDGYSLFGVEIPGEDITRACTGASNECPMEGDECARTMASAALPVSLRVHSDFIWQRNPFELGRQYSVDGLVQSPGLDLIEIFWLARHYDVIDAGQGQALAWRAVGTCE